jgi:hypothetical protein
MNLDLVGYFITFASGIGALLVFLQLRSMYNTRQDAKKKKEMAVLLSKLRNTKELLAGAKRFPFSRVLYTCLYHRQLSVLDAIQVLEPDNVKLNSRAEYLREQLRLFNTSSTFNEKQSFDVPTNELEAIELIKLIKKFRSIIRTSRSSGVINGTSAVYESTRLDAFQTRITIGNLIKRANYAIEHGQTEMARGLVRRGKSYLNSKSGTQSIDTVVRLNEQLEELDNKLSEELEFHELISSSLDEQKDDELITVDIEEPAPASQEFDGNNSESEPPAAQEKA